MRRRMTAVITVALMAVFAGGCESPTGAGKAAVVGDYALVSVNGGPVPARIYEDNTFVVRIMNATLSLRENGSYVEPFTIETFNKQTFARQTENASDQGTYKVSGRTISFTSATGEQYSGTVQNLANGGQEITYTAALGEGVQVSLTYLR